MSSPAADPFPPDIACERERGGGLNGEPVGPAGLFDALGIGLRVFEAGLLGIGPKEGERMPTGKDARLILRILGGSGGLTFFFTPPAPSPLTVGFSTSIGGEADGENGFDGDGEGEGETEGYGLRNGLAEPSLLFRVIGDASSALNMRAAISCSDLRAGGSSGV